MYWNLYSHPHFIASHSSQCPFPPTLHPFPSSTWHFECVQSLPVKFIRTKLSLWWHWSMRIHIIHVPLSLYLAKAFLRVHHWQLVKPTSKLLYSAQKNGFDAFDRDVFVRFHFRLDCWSFSLLGCRASANKISGRAELLRTGRGFGLVGIGVWCVSAVKLLSPREAWEQKGFHYRVYSWMKSCVGLVNEKLPIHWFSFDLAAHIMKSLECVIFLFSVCCNNFFLFYISF